MTRLLAISDGSEYVDMPVPSVYKAKPEEVVKAGRNTMGTLYKERITVKRTISLEWHGISPEAKNQILTATKGNSFNARYYDPEEDAIQYGLFYRGNDLEITPLVKWDADRDEFIAYDITMSLVEFRWHTNRRKATWTS